MSVYWLWLYYNSNDRKEVLSSRRVVRFDGPAREMLRATFPQYLRTGWSVDTERGWAAKHGLWDSSRDGLYILVERPPGQDKRIYMGLWRPREWKIIRAPWEVRRAVEELRWPA